MRSFDMEDDGVPNAFSKRDVKDTAFEVMCMQQTLCLVYDDTDFVLDRFHGPVWWIEDFSHHLLGNLFATAYGNRSAQIAVA